MRTKDASFLASGASKYARHDGRGALVAGGWIGAAARRVKMVGEPVLGELVPSALKFIELVPAVVKFILAFEEPRAEARG
jgi:hypothetical protein